MREVAREEAAAARESEETVKKSALKLAEAKGRADREARAAQESAALARRHETIFFRLGYPSGARAVPDLLL